MQTTDAVRHVLSKTSHKVDYEKLKIPFSGSAAQASSMSAEELDDISIAMWQAAISAKKG